MPNKTFTEVSRNSWSGRIRGSITGLLIGILIFLAGFPLLFWNEGRAIQRHKTLIEGGRTVVSIAADRVDPANSDKLVHLTGLADTDEVLTDPVFGVSVNALKLTRSVEMYQWTENSESKTERKRGGETETVTTYSYSKTWSERPIRSANFKIPEGHENPAEMPFNSMHQTAQRVSLGAFILPDSLINRIQNFEPFHIDSENALPQAIDGRAQFHDGGFYIGANPSAPEVGDTRINFRIVRPTEISVMAMQIDDTFEPYRTSVGGTINLLQTGVHTSEEMIVRAQRDNMLLTWLLRFAGFMMMFVGLMLFMRPMAVIADFLPFLGRIVSAGTGIISFLISSSLSLTTIAIAWIFYRPLLGILLLLVVAALLFTIRKRVKS